MTQTQTSQPQAARRVSLELDSPELASTYEEVSTRQFNHGKLLGIHGHALEGAEYLKTRGELAQRVRRLSDEMNCY